MAIMESSVVPIGTASTSLSEWVAHCLRILEERGIKYELTSMGTQIEGQLEELLEIAQRMHEQPFLRGAKRVLTLIKIDDRRDKSLSLGSKRQSVREKLTRKA